MPEVAFNVKSLIALCLTYILYQLVWALHEKLFDVSCEGNIQTQDWSSAWHILLGFNRQSREGFNIKFVMTGLKKLISFLSTISDGVLHTWSHYIYTIRAKLVLLVLVWSGLGCVGKKDNSMNQLQFKYQTLVVCREMTLTNLIKPTLINC